MELVRLEHISKIYRANGIEFTALKQISLGVAMGEFMALAGPSGSGKTTLLNIVGCLDQPTAGILYLSAEQVCTKKSSELAIIRRHQIGFIFQTFNLIPVMTAFENVELPLMLLNSTGEKERRESVETILEDVGLKDLMHRKPNQMSGGQQQRVAIARALVKKPRLILADEPTANLDSKTGSEILDVMLQMNRKTGAAFIFSTHDRMVIDFARRVVKLKDGEIEADEKRG